MVNPINSHPNVQRIPEKTERGGERLPTAKESRKRIPEKTERGGRDSRRLKNPGKESRKRILKKEKMGGRWGVKTVERSMVEEGRRCLDRRLDAQRKTEIKRKKRKRENK